MGEDAIYSARSRLHLYAGFQKMLEIKKKGGKKMFRKICNILSAIIFAVLVAIAGLLVVPNVLGFQSFAVLSGSMMPEIQVGEIVYAKEVATSELEVGDVITYHLTGSTMVTHRIVGINENEQTVITKGDANDTVDGTPVTFSNIKGRVGFHVPYLGYISIYIKTSIGILTICGIAMLLFLLNFLPDVVEREKEAVKQKE